MFGKRFWVVVLLVSVLALPLSGASAQGNWPVFCGDLPVADCDVLIQANEALEGLNASAFEMTMDFGIAAQPESIMDGVDEFAMTVNAAGAVELLLPSELEALFQDPTTMMDLVMGQEMLDEVMRAVSGEVALELVLPENLPGMDEMPGSLATTIMMEDGVFYFDLTDLTPEAEEGAPGWIGLDLASMFSQLTAFSMMEMDAEIMEMQTQMQQSVMEMMSDPEMLAAFLTIERLDDAEVDGQPVAVFHTVLDYGAMYGSEAMQSVLQEYVEAMLEMEGLPADELPDNFGEALSVMMGDSMMDMVQWIGLEDYYTHHTEMDLALMMDFQAMAEMMPEEDFGGETPSLITVTMALTVDAHDFNAPVTVTVPEDALVIDPMAALMGEMMDNNGS